MLSTSGPLLFNQPGRLQITHSSSRVVPGELFQIQRDQPSGTAAFQSLPLFLLRLLLFLIIIAIIVVIIAIISTINMISLLAILLVLLLSCDDYYCGCCYSYCYSYYYNHYYCYLS